MGCCCKGSEDSTVSDSPKRLKKCQDVIWLLLFVAGTCYSYTMALEARKVYKPIYSNGADSWGNICGFDGEQNRHNYAEVDLELNGGYPDFTPTSMAYTPTHYMLDHTKNTMMYFSEFTLTSTATTVCLPDCPGSKLTDTVKDIYTSPTKLQKLAAIVAAAPSTKTAFETAVGTAFGFSQIDNAADITAFTDEIWCEAVMTKAGYGTNSTSICTDSIKHTVLTPSSTLANRCTPHYMLALQVANMAAGDSADTPQNQTSIAKLSTVVSEGASAAIAYNREIMWSFLISVAVALLIIFLIQVLTKYIIMTVVILFALSAMGAMAFTLFQYKQIDDPTWGVDCTGSSGSSRSSPALSAYEPVYHDGSIMPNAARDDIEQRLLSLCAANATALTDEEHEKARTFAKYTMAITWTISGIALVTILCCCGNIRLAVTLFDEAGQCVFAIPGILLQPIWTLFITIIVTGCLLWKFIFVTQVLVPIADADNAGQVVWTSPSFGWNYFWVYTLFITFWVLVFIDGCHQVSMAGAVSDWFWKHEEAEMEEDTGCADKCSLCPARAAMCDMVRYNLGSIALGSLLIAIVRTIQVIIWLIQRTAKQSAGGKEPNKFMKAIFCCLQCMLKCVEKFLEFINRNAFIGIAIFGYNFCRSAQKTIALKVENAGRAVVLMAICAAVLFMGKLVSIVGSLFFFRYMLNSTGDADLDLNSQIGIYSCVAIFAWWITGIFLSVYRLTLDTIFVCFCEDQQRNNGRDRPYKSSMQLQKFMRENA